MQMKMQMVIVSSRFVFEIGSLRRSTDDTDNPF